MMQNKLTIGLVVVLAIALGAVGVILQLPQMSFGSVATTEVYLATSTEKVGDGHKLLHAGPTMLGSVVITSSSSPLVDLVLWNATSTTDVASTSFLTIKAPLAQGTYTFDVQLNRGLVVNMGTGYAATGAKGLITWK